MTGSPYRVDLGPGPPPAAVIARLGRRPAAVAALWGRWFGGGTIVLTDPSRTESAARAEDAFAIVDDQPPLAPSTDQDLIGGGWLACLGYAPGRSWLGFFDHLWRHRPGIGWSFESLGLAERSAADADSQAELRGLLAGPVELPRSPGPLVTKPFAAAADALPTHLRGVESVIAGIERGEYYQLNLCTRLRSRLAASATGPGAAARIFAEVADRLRPTYAALLDFGDGRSLLSLSPELFWREHAGRVDSAPIKGTSAQAQDPTGAVLAASVKDRAENVMITDLMRNDLSRVCRPGTVAVVRLLDLERHPGVWHLVSSVSGALRPGTSHGDLLRATFPPGSVTGAPKLSALAGIAATETESRGAYTGALGLVTPQAGAEFNVIIRTFEIDGDQIELGVGGGITVDSVPVREWYECLHKAEPLVHALGTDLAFVLRERPPPVPAGLRATGLIETMLAQDGEVLRQAAHLARLDRSARELYGLGLPTGLVERVRQVAARQPAGRHRIRLHAVAGRDLEVAVESHPVAAPPRRIRLVRRDRPAWCWRHKWADRSSLAEPDLSTTTPGVLTLPYFMTPAGHLGESSRGNLCLRGADGIWCSPPESEHVLPGVTRRDLLRALVRRGDRIRIDDVALGELDNASALLHCSSVSGVVIVDRLDESRFETGDELDGLVRELNLTLGFDAGVTGSAP